MAKLDTITAMVAAHPREAAKALRKLGKGQDTVLAHLEPWEARLLDKATDGGAINPRTGLPMFEDGAGGSGEGTGTGSGEGGDNGVGGNDSGSGTSGGGGGGGGGTAGGGSVGGDTSFGGWGSDPSMGPGGRDDSIGGGVGGDTSFSNWTDDPTMGPNAREDQISERSGGVDWSQYDMQRTFVDHTPSTRSLSPVAAAPQRPAVRKAVDNWNNTIGKVTAFRQEVGWDPAKGELAPHNYFDVNPTSLALGAITGLPVGQIMDFFEVSDPYGFSVDMGYGTDTPAGPGTGDGNQQEGRGFAGRAATGGAGPVLSNPGTLTPVGGSSYVPPTPLSGVTPVSQTKLRARRGMAGDYAPNFKTSAV